MSGEYPLPVFDNEDNVALVDNEDNVALMVFEPFVFSLPLPFLTQWQH